MGDDARASEFYEAGRRCFREGGYVSENPEGLGSYRGVAWFDGYMFELVVALRGRKTKDSENG